jgi:hypothetical protein
MTKYKGKLKSGLYGNKRNMPFTKVPQAMWQLGKFCFQRGELKNDYKIGKELLLKMQK